MRRSVRGSRTRLARIADLLALSAWTVNFSVLGLRYQYSQLIFLD